MSQIERRRGGGAIPSFHGEAQAFPEEEIQGAPTALAIAIAEAAMSAAAHLGQAGIDEADFEVSSIRIKVARNPGPTSYRVRISPL